VRNSVHTRLDLVASVLNLVILGLALIPSASGSVPKDGVKGDEGDEGEEGEEGEEIGKDVNPVKRMHLH
jgi:hypothetical protein